MFRQKWDNLVIVWRIYRNSISYNIPKPIVMMHTKIPHNA